MTVQELINELEKVRNKNLNVNIRGTDPTDWVYNNDVKSVKVEKVYWEIEDGKVKSEMMLVIDGGIF